MACAIIGIFFLRFWRQTRDRLFAIFALCFWLLGLNWLLLAFTQVEETQSAYLHCVRMAAFAILLFGIADKNRARRRK